MKVLGDTFCIKREERTTESGIIIGDGSKDETKYGVVMYSPNGEYDGLCVFYHDRGLKTTVKGIQCELVPADFVLLVDDDE